MQHEALDRQAAEELIFSPPDVPFEPKPLGAGDSLESLPKESFGYSTLLATAITDVPGAIEVYEAIEAPDGPWILRLSAASVLLSGKQVAIATWPIQMKFVKVIYVNGGAPQGEFQFLAYLRPV